MATRMQHCDFCGAELGVFDHHSSDGPLSCGERACERYARETERAIQDEAEERAREDGFSHYGGLGPGW